MESSTWPRSGEPRPARHDAGEDPPLGLEQVADVGAVEAAPLLPERAQPLVVGERAEAHPGEVEVHLQVGELRVGERRGEPLRIAAAQVPPALVEQLPVARHRAHVAAPSRP